MAAELQELAAQDVGGLADPARADRLMALQGLMDRLQGQHPRPPDHLAAEAEPVLLAAARRLDPPRLRRVIAHLRLVADPDGAEGRSERQHQQRGLWLAPTWEGMVA